VVCGIGGAGKTTLVAEVAEVAEVAGRVRDRDPGRVQAGLAGPLTLESLLGTVAATIRRELLAGGHPDAATLARALDVVMRADVGWRVAEEALAGLLAARAGGPGRSRLLVTCRYRFTLPGGAQRYLAFRQLGALSRAETMKLDRLQHGLAGGRPTASQVPSAHSEPRRLKHMHIASAVPVKPSEPLGVDALDPASHWRLVGGWDMLFCSVVDKHGTVARISPRDYKAHTGVLPGAA
jgi:hypothetical protein